jgi:ribosomal RNA-processing protein 9
MALTNGDAEAEHVATPNVRGFVNAISVFERGDRGKDGLCVVAALGKDHRLGRFFRKDMNGSVRGKNGAVVFEVPRMARPNGQEVMVNGTGGHSDDEE